MKRNYHFDKKKFERDIIDAAASGILFYALQRFVAPIVFKMITSRRRRAHESLKSFNRHKPKVRGYRRRQ